MGKVKMFVANTFFSALVIFIIACASVPPSDQSTNTTQYADALRFSEQAKWVVVITDVMVPGLCQAGKLPENACKSYALASDQLKRDVIAIDDLMAKGATQETVRTAVAEALKTYLIIDQAYKGNVV